MNSFNPSVDGYAFATPRSWYFCSELLQEMDTEGKLVDTTLPADVLGDMVKGTIGDGIGVKFLSYRKQAANLPHAKDVLSGKVKKLASKQIDVMYALTTALCYELQDVAERATKAERAGDKKAMEEFHTQAETFFRFIMDNFEEELTVMAGKTVLGTYKLPIKSKLLGKTWEEFASRYADLLPNG